MKPEYTNPWPYIEKLPALTEDMKLSREDLCDLECRIEYNINCKISMPLYQDVKFMRQWLRLYALSH